MDAAQWRAIEDGRFEDLPELNEIIHPAVLHLLDVFSPEHEFEGSRPTISKLGYPPVYKLKTSQYRGAVHVDQEGRAWLIAVGIRRDGDVDDFYESIDDQASLLPTEADQKRLRVEDARRRLREWRREICLATVHAVAQSSTDGSEVTVDLPPLGTKVPAGQLSIQVYRLDYSGLSIASSDVGSENVPAEVNIDVRLGGWEHKAARDAALLCVACVIAPSEEQWDATPGPAGVSYTADCTESRLEQLMLISQLNDRHDMTELMAEVVPDCVAPVSQGHVVPKSTLVDALVDGNAVRALCGQWFVPRQDPGDMPRCEDCVDAHSAVMEHLGVSPAPLS